MLDDGSAWLPASHLQLLDLWPFVEHFEVALQPTCSLQQLGHCPDKLQHLLHSVLSTTEAAAPQLLAASTAHIQVGRPCREMHLAAVCQGVDKGAGARGAGRGGVASSCASLQVGCPHVSPPLRPLPPPACRPCTGLDLATDPVASSCLLLCLQALHWFDLATDPVASYMDYGSVANEQAEKALQSMCNTMRQLLRHMTEVRAPGAPGGAGL